MPRSREPAARPQRLTPQKQQELVSRSQLVENLSGWICNSLGEDFGEDFFVSIYDDGRSTGLTFQLQLKSVTDINARIPKRSTEEIRYGLDVVDLEHWEDASPPVVVVVWDVTRREGYWQDVPAIIAKLLTTNPNWRTKTTVKVSLPRAHKLDKRGRARLRSRIGPLLLPAISSGKTLEIKPTFRFPKTKEGRVALAGLRAAIEDGESVTIRKENIVGMTASPWWERIFGRRRPDEITITPAISEQRFDLFMDAIGDAGTERILLHMRRTKAGTKRSTFASDSERDPMHVTLTLDTDANALAASCGFSFPCSGVPNCLLLVRALLIFRKGGSLLLALPTGKPLGALRLDPECVPPTESLQAWERLLSMLSVIQSRTARYGIFALRPDLTNEDLAIANQVRAMCTSAQDETRMTFSMNIDSPLTGVPVGDDKAGAPSYIEIDPYGDFELLGVTIPKGKVRVEFLDRDDVIQEFRAAQRERRTTIKFENTRVRLHYLEWVAPLTGPAASAASRILRHNSDAAARVHASKRSTT